MTITETGTIMGGIVRCAEPLRGFSFGMVAPAKYPNERRCAWCGSTDTHFVQRGLTGPTDETDQYIVCHKCGAPTYDFVAKTSREMRLGRYRAGGIFRDSNAGTRYEITRVFKIGTNEHLLYLRPLPGVSSVSGSGGTPD